MLRPIPSCVGLLVALTCSAAAQPPVGAQRAPASLRFHHVHYQVGDPAAAMAEALRVVDGVRVIAQGLGVGVRTGRELLLFDRTLETEQARPQRPASAAYAAAVEQLQRLGFAVEPTAANQVRAAHVFATMPVHHVAFTTDRFDDLIEQLAGSGAIMLSRTAESVMFQAGDLRFELVRDTERDESFWCPMHPDVRSADFGKCPVCGMDLVPIPPPKIGEYGLDVEVERDVRSGSVRALRFGVRDPDTNALVTELRLVHERTFHLFIISRDLRFFDHVHPERQEDGTYELRQTLPPGEYMLIADFLPAAGTSQMVQRAIISGRSLEPAAPEIDRTNTSSRTADGLTVTLRAEQARAGREVALAFEVRDGKTGEPVTDLQPYLGAPAHMLIVPADLSDAIHAHPEEVATAGPTVSFHPLIPAPGDYKLWIQFQRAGRVVTVPFWLRAGM